MPRQKGPPKTRVPRNIQSAEELEARDSLLASKNERRRAKDVAEENAEASSRERANSDLDLLDFGNSDAADQLEDVRSAMERARLPVFEKEKPLTMATLAKDNSKENPNAKKEKIGRPIKASDIDLEAVGDESRMSRKERENLEARRAEAELMRAAENGETAEAQKDLARLEEIREQRERAAQRREYEAAKKEKLRQAAAKRAEELEKKKQAKGQKGKKGKKR